MIGAAERNSVGRLIRAREQRRGGGGGRVMAVSIIARK